MKNLQDGVNALYSKYFMPSEFRISLKPIKRLYDNQRSSGDTEEKAIANALSLAEEQIRQAADIINKQVNKRADQFLQQRKAKVDIMVAINAAKEQSISAA